VLQEYAEVDANDFLKAVPKYLTSYLVLDQAAPTGSAAEQVLPECNAPRRLGRDQSNKSCHFSSKIPDEPGEHDIVRERSRDFGENMDVLRDGEHLWQ